MPRIQHHVHKLKRFKYKSTGSAIFFCTLPDCNYKTDTHLTLGKKCICWRCGKDFIINEYSLRLARPHCMACKKNKEPGVPLENITGSIANSTADDLRTRLSKTISNFSSKEVEI